MDTTAHRIIRQARSLLVDELRLGFHQVAAGQWVGGKWVPHTAPTYPHGLGADQAAALEQVIDVLWHLATDDPAPPECDECATPLIQPATGRPRRYCSDACRQASHRTRSAVE